MLMFRDWTKETSWFSAPAPALKCWLFSAVPSMSNDPMSRVLAWFSRQFLGLPALIAHPGPCLLRANRERLAGVQGAAMSPLVAARMRRNAGMEARRQRLSCHPVHMFPLM